MKFTTAFALTSIAALSACSTGGGGLVVSPATAELDLAAGTTIEFNEENNQIVISDGATTEALSTFASTNGFARFFGSSADIFRGETSSGEGVVAFNSRAGFGEFGVAERLSPTTIPASGLIEYSGTYLGAVREDVFSQLNSVVSGDANFTANFDANTIDGSITNRSLGNDVVLNATSISDGTFSGTATTTASVSLGNPSNGEFTGLFAGENAGEIVGLIRIEHDDIDTNGPGIEIGGFVAEQDTP